MPDTPSSIKSLARNTLLRLTNPGLIFPIRNSAKGEIKRIIIVRPDHLGDLLFATPALNIVRKALPDAHITGLVGPWGRAIWLGSPNLDALEVVRFPGIVARHEGGALGSYRLLNTTARSLSKGRYDLGIVLRFDHWWGAAMLAAAGVPRRWGYDTPGMKSWLTNVVAYTSGRHEVEQNLRLVEAVLYSVGAHRTAPLPEVLEINRAKGLPRLRPPLAEPVRDDSLAPWLAEARRVVIHPGTTAANKLWTIGGWAKVTRNLLDEGWAVAITGSPDEKRLADPIMEAIGPSLTEGSVLVNMAGRTASLGQLVWVLGQASMALGVDNGPLHIADALGKPSLHLYGPSDEAIWGPWGDPAMHRAFRAPGTRPTMRLETGSPALQGGPEMRSITAEMVWEEIGRLSQINRNK
jgi:ADP-heptose:LPS heptosyltransferase